MQKCLIDLYVPGLAQHFDTFMPVDLQIRKLIPVIIEGINGLSSAHYAPSGKEMLLDVKTNTVLNPERCLCNYPIQDGDRLIIM